MRIPPVERNWLAAVDVATVIAGYRPGYVDPNDYAKDVEPIARILLDVAEDYQRSAEVTEAARRHRKGRKPNTADVTFIVGVAGVLTEAGRSLGFRRIKRGKPEQTTLQHLCNAFLHGIDPEREGDLPDAAFKTARAAFSTENVKKT